MEEDYIYGTYGYFTSKEKSITKEDAIICYIERMLRMPASMSQVDLLQEISGNSITSKTSLVTHCDDWGLRKHRSCEAMMLSIESSGVFEEGEGQCYPQVSLDIKEISKNVRRWYLAQTRDDAGHNTYPIPLNVNKELWTSCAALDLRNVSKDKLCLANFTMTCPQRIYIAEWAWQQEYIDCLFPKRYEKQDKDLNMSILTDEKLNPSDCLRNLASYNYALSPIGNGVDCFRTWECIMCNTVPIVQNNFMNRVFAQIWPMILVNRYQTDNIRHKIVEFEKRNPNIEYDYSLLLEKNFAELLDRLEYESNRLRRTGV